MGAENGEIVIRGIKCDSCDWDDMSVRYEDYATWLDRPCPKCSANLLTQADLDLCRVMVAASKVMGIGLGDPDKPDDPNQVRISVGMNGSGKIESLGLKGGEE